MVNRFNIGDRVQSSQQAITNRVFQRQRFGIVVGCRRGTDIIHVKVDGLKTPGNFHKIFWDRISNRTVAQDEN